MLLEMHTSWLYVECKQIKRFLTSTLTWVIPYKTVIDYNFRIQITIMLYVYFLLCSHIVVLHISYTEQFTILQIIPVL
jgi:hypothetical protein